jgi:hypothetical protein
MHYRRAVNANSIEKISCKRYKISDMIFTNGISKEESRANVEPQFLSQALTKRCQAPYQMNKPNMKGSFDDFALHNQSR